MNTGVRRNGLTGFSWFTTAIVLVAIASGAVGAMEFSTSLRVVSSSDVREFAPSHAIIDRSLQYTPAIIHAIEEGAVRYTDENGVDRTRGLDELVAIIQTGNGNGTPFDEGNGRRSARSRSNRTAEPTGPYLALTDGQLIPGNVVSEAADPETLSWVHEHLGQMTVPLSEILYVQFMSASAVFSDAANGLRGTAATSGDDRDSPDSDEEVIGDQLLLSNGDRLVGFLAGFHGSTVTFEADQQPVEIELERVASILLENPREQPAYETCRAWLTDGSVLDIRADRLETRGNGLRVALDPDGEDRWLRFDDIEALSFRFGAVVPLVDRWRSMDIGTDAEMNADAPSTSTWLEGGERPVVTASNRPLGLADLHLIGPASFEFELPKNAERLAATAAVPREALAWASFDLHVAVDGRVVQEHHFDARSPSIDLLVVFPDGAERLSVTIVEGEAGPIYNMLSLQRPRLLIREP